MKKKILELCLSPDLGGLELSVVDIYKAFKKDTQVYICVSNEKKLDIFLGENIEKLVLNYSRIGVIFNAIKLAQYIDRNKIDVLHFHWTKDMLLAVLTKTFVHRNLILIQSRHMTMTRFKSDFYHRWLYKNITMIHAVTNQVKKQLEKFIPLSVRPKIDMIYLGIKEKSINDNDIKILKCKYNINDNQFVVSIVGRIEEEKGQWLLIEALKKVSDLNIKLLIVGHAMDTIYLNKLKDKVKEYCLENKVIFTGFTNDVNAYFKLCDVSVLATTQETFGLVVVEAMINEVVMIATNKGGPVEIIDDGIDGLLFDRTVGDLADKLYWLYFHKKEVKEMAKKAKKKVLKKFEYKKQVDKLYKSISSMDG